MEIVITKLVFHLALLEKLLTRVLNDGTVLLYCLFLFFIFIYHILRTKYGPCRRGQYSSKFFYIHTLPLQYTFTAEQNSCTLKIREKQGTNTGKEADLSDKKRGIVSSRRVEHRGIMGQSIPIRDSSREK